MKHDTPIISSDGTVFIYEKYFSEIKATHFFLRLKKNLDWYTESIHIFRKNIVCPRRVAWYGEPGTNYIYSGNDHLALGWSADLLVIKDVLEQRIETRFNFVLCHYYRDGEDYIGWHDDNEKELGNHSIIASVSFGAMRRFEFRHKQNKKTRIAVNLNHGSVLVMSGVTQQYWQHRLPKDKKCDRGRINLSFRSIIQS